MSTQTEDEESAFDINVRDLLSSVIDAYRYMGISPERYLAIVLLPTVALAAGIVGVLVVVRPEPIVAFPVAMLGFLPVLGALVYPKVVADRKRREVREQFHLFLTHITVLSLTNIDRVEVFRTLANIDEYGALAEEMGRITALVDTWNQSLDDACRRRAKRVSSDMLADFLERLAYTVGAGQSLSDFLVEEQESMIDEFVTRYESDLAKIDVLKELYMSMMLSTTFILVFATVLPLLLGVPATLLLTGVIVMFAIVQGGFLFVIHQTAPRDPVWLNSTDERNHSPARRVQPHVFVGVGLSIIAVVAVLALGLGYTPIASDRIPRPMYVAIPTLPLLIPGLAMRREENRVSERDEGFPSFIRALGGVESVKQSSTANVLEMLRTKDFGSLTPNIDNLYKRLRTRINSKQAWTYFGAETGSYLIQKFGDMYVVGRRMGGEPRQLGSVISTNITEVLHLRDQREQETATLIGIIYGITAASLFSAFIGLEIAGQMLEITTRLQQSGELALNLFSTGGYDIAVMEYLLILVILVNAMLSSIMIRISDRGHFVNALPHFVGLTWVGALVASGTSYIVSGLI
ncbi:MAG: archaellar assembly protein FlaJ [Halobacteriales archaeon]|nr:archaellar assembly protein FlaJ [Halobacteriales archaeon]